MDREDPNRTRSIGDYMLGPRIGSGSFAVVWRATHRQSGIQVAVKEIDKKQLHPVVNENLMREIEILRNINHPNIIRLIDAIQTADRIYLVLEYCDGGDLAAYIHRDGKVPEAVARHFMRQLAAGLQILNEKNLIHRDLKPQNLLLSTNKMTPLLKIGDFGFARHLKPQGLADTLCGSPLYMAPEIIQNQKYDAKADLWSVGAILFQLVTGKPPFDGNSQLQLFQNVLTSSELRFPQGALEELHPDCVDLCRSLLRQNPVERLSFKEFFNHKFLVEPRLRVDVEESSLLPQVKSLAEQFECLTDEKLPSVSNKGPQLQFGLLLNPSDRNPDLTSSLHDRNINILHRKDHGSTSSNKGVCELMSNTACDKLRKSVDGDFNSSGHRRVADSMESIEKEYVLVDPHFASMEIFSSSRETFLQGNSAARVSVCPPNEQDITVAFQTKALTTGSVGGAESVRSHDSDPLVASTILREMPGLSKLDPSSRLQLLYQYVNSLSELAREKFNAGLFLESFSVELVVLAIWKEVLRVHGSWLASTAENDVPGSSSANESTPVQEGAGLSLDSRGNIDFCRPSSVSIWAGQGFMNAFDRVEKLSDHLQDNTEMPDALEIIYRTALAAGIRGAVDGYLENKQSAAASYSKAKLLLSFIVGEAMSLPLNPPFSLTDADKERIQGYIRKLERHEIHSQMSRPSP